MESTNPTSRRNMSQDMEGKQFSTFGSKTREITKAISNRDPSSLLKMSFRRTSVTQDRSTDENFDSSVQLLVLKKTINLQKLFVGKGDSKVSILKQELKQLEIEETKRDFWHRQNTLKLKQLENSLEEALKSQTEEIHNQEIYNHLLKRMKKTKVFLELKSFALNNSLENSESILRKEQKKNLLSQELAVQTVNTFKDFKKAVISEKGEGNSQIFDLQKSIEKSRIVSERRDT